MTQQAGGLPPWLTIWYRPRRTIRRIIDTDPSRGVLLIAGFSGVTDVLNYATRTSLGDQVQLPVLLAAAAFLGPLLGIAGVFLMAAVYRAVARFFHGEATTREVRAACAWSQIPTAVQALLYVPALVMFREELFTTEMPRLDSLLEANPILGLVLVFIMLGLGAASVLLALWSLVLKTAGLAEVFGFSGWRALGTMLAPGLLLVPVVCVVFWNILPLIPEGRADRAMTTAYAEWPSRFYEEFTDNVHEWPVGRFDETLIEYTNTVTNGKYYIDARAKSGVVDHEEPKAGNVSTCNQLVSVEARRLSGPTNSEYGLAFRKSSADYYYFRISDSGRFRLSARVSSEWIAIVPSTASNAIRPGEVNVIAVVAEGQALNLFINGQRVGRAKDAALACGGAGVVIGLKKDDAGIFEFDNFEIRAP